jgi:ankyrin repeat protein
MLKRTIIGGLVLTLGAASVATAQTARTQARTTSATALSAQLISAARDGDVRAVRTLLARKANANAAEADGTTALHWAARNDSVEIADLLLQAGANPNAANRYGVTPLPLAATNGSAIMVEALLKAGASPNSAMGAGETALMAAARSGNLQAVKALLARGADVNAVEQGLGQSALMFAAIENHPTVVQALAEAGANVNAASSLLVTPELKLPKNFVTDGARGSFPKGGMSALHLAARQGSIDAVRALVKAGAKIDQTQPEGITPLIMAIFNGHYDVAKELVELGADPNLGDSANRTPLYMAVDMHTLEWLFSRPTPRPSGAMDSVDLVKYLLAKGVARDPRLTKRPPAIGIGGSGHNASLTVGATPLMKAATTSDVELIQILLDAGANPHLTTEDHTTPLMMAAGLNWRDIGSLGTDDESLQAIKIFMAKGLDVNAFNDDGQTAVHGAAQRGSIAVLEFLIQQGAKAKTKNKRGRIPLDEAAGDEGLNGERRQARPAAVAMLSKLGAVSAAR